MPFQTFVSSYPELQLAGESHSNARHTSIYQTCHNPVDAVKFGTAQVRTGLYDHTRWTVSNPSVTNLVAGSDLVVVSRCRTAANSYTGTRFADANVLGGYNGENPEVPADCQHLAMRRGIIYVIVEKDIDPENPVYIRVDNPANAFQGIGYFTDTADGANTVEVTDLISRDTKWCGVDGATYIASKDVNVTPALHRQRIKLSSGFSIAPLSLKYV